MPTTFPIPSFPEGTPRWLVLSGIILASFTILLLFFNKWTMPAIQDLLQRALGIKKTINELKANDKALAQVMTPGPTPQHAVEKVDALASQPSIDIKPGEDK